MLIFVLIVNNERKIIPNSTRLIPNYLSLKLFKTTETELNAIAAPAIIGFSVKPINGYKTPAAIGIPMIL
jgi:hypothetical protein